MNHSDAPAASILDMRVGELLERLGSSEPAPGGGAAAALVGALGAALVRMTANLTIGRPRLAAVEDQARRLAAQAAELSDRLAQLGDADTRAFEQVSAAYKLPRESEDEKAARSAAIQAALRVAASVPLETAQACGAVLAIAEEAAPVLNSAVISDVLVGALLARAGLEGAALNVEINLAAMTDAASVDRLAAALDLARGKNAGQVERILDVGRSRVPKPVQKS